MKIVEGLEPLGPRNLRRMQSKGRSLGVMIPRSLLDRLGWQQMDALKFALATDDDGNPTGILVQLHHKNRHAPDPDLVRDWDAIDAEGWPDA